MAFPRDGGTAGRTGDARRAARATVPLHSLTGTSGTGTSRRGSADYWAHCGGATEHGISTANRFRPLKREQLRVPPAVYSAVLHPLQYVDPARQRLLLRQLNAMTYARNTTVSAIRTRNEIEETLERYGADAFAYATQGNLATVIFAMENRRIRFVLELPDPEDFRYTNHNPPREPSRKPTTRPAVRGGGHCCWSSRPSWRP